MWSRVSIFIGCFWLSWTQTAKGAELQDKEWLRLGHWYPTWSLVAAGNTYQSTISGEDFFLAPSGASDPAAEFAADVLAFAASATQQGVGGDLQCRFPSRHHYLQKRGLVPGSAHICPALADWKQRLNVGSISVVFASQYAGNPASFFGHAFFKLNGRGHQYAGKDLAALDQTLGYFAQIPPETSGVRYIVGGLSGEFVGSFTQTPFSQLAQEYGDLESRQLWEYELNLNDVEVEAVLDQIWELSHGATLPYYFLDQNCAYQILAVIEVVHPDWRLTDPSRLYVAPLDAVQTLARVGAIRHVSFRPSLHDQVRAAFARLTPSGREAAFDLISGALEVEQCNDAAALAAVCFYLQQQTLILKGVGSPELEDRSAAVLSKLAQFGPQEPALSPMPEPVHSAHGAKRATLELGTRESRRFVDLGFRPGLHDLLENAAGYSHNSAIELAVIKLRQYRESKAPTLENCTFFGVTSLQPQGPLDHPLSANVQARWYRPHANRDNDGAAVQLEAQLGYAWDFTLVSLSATAFALAGGDLERGNGFSAAGREALRFPGSRVGPKLQSGMILQPRLNWRLHFHEDVLDDFSANKIRSDLTLQSEFDSGRAQEILLSWHSGGIGGAELAFGCGVTF